MGQYIERMHDMRSVSFANATQSNELMVGGYEQHWLFIHGNLVGTTLNIEVQRPNTTTWQALRDATGTQIAIPTTSAGVLPIAELPPGTKIRFTVAGAITETTFLLARS